jgi:hypothetical protein
MINFKLLPYAVAFGMVVLASSLAFFGHQNRLRQEAIISTLTVERDAANKRADHNAREAAELHAQIVENERLAAEAAATRRSLQALTQEVQNAIASSPPTADGPVAPVLSDALDRLRQAKAPD